MPSKSKRSRDRRKRALIRENNSHPDSIDHGTPGLSSVPQNVDCRFFSPTMNEPSRYETKGSVAVHSVGNGQGCRAQHDESRDGTARDQRDSEPSPVSENDDSGFTSSSASDAFRGGCEDSDTIQSARESESVSHLSECELELKQELPKNAPLPRRPGFGKLGKKIELISNCYPLKVPEGNVYHYDVEVIGLVRNPESDAVPGGAEKSKKYRCLKTKVKRKVIELMVERDAIFDGLYPAYDGEKNLYTRKPLHSPFPHIFTTNDEDEIQAQVEIKPVKKKNTVSCAINMDTIHAYFERQIDSMPMEAIAALETIMRHGACLRLTPIGHSFFSPPGPGCLNPLAGGLEIWYGYHQSVRISQWQPTVNIDISATTFFPSGPLLKYLARFLDMTVDGLRYMPFLADRDRNRLNRKLEGKRIATSHSHLRRKYTVMWLERESAANLRVDENGLTVARYFKERYDINLVYSNLPCLRVKPRERNVYLPIELCELVPGQHYNSELTQAQKSEMIKYTSSDPKPRFEKISNNMNFGNDRCTQEFEVEVSEDPLEVEGRTLDPPSLIYGSEQKIRPRDGAWNMLHQDAKFLDAVVIKKWALLYFADIRRDSMRKFEDLLEETGSSLGIDIKEPHFKKFVRPRYDIIELLTRMKNEIKADLVIIVIPDNNENLYRHIKKSAETVIGLITQCIRQKTVLKITNPRTRCASQLVANLFLKINAKMEGINYTLVLSEIPSLLWKPVIVIGADVNHPGAYRELKESLAACAGSLDARCSLYAVRTRPQKNKNSNKMSTEIIVDLQSMVVDLLRAFYRHTKKKPEKIIFYRDGVSEGELLKVRDSEVSSVRKACREIQVDYKPGITFIVVQKRHHVRFTEKFSRLNVPPGTVIDTGVTHPQNFDFFLGSQKCPKGTAKPAHYTVIADDNEFTADDLQKFTNQLAYTYVRCTKSISIPAPVAYAHLAAYRARQYLDAGRQGSSSSSSGDSLPGRNSACLEDVIVCTKVVDELRNRMYFV
uniref:Putative argonaute n=1 Tax=Cupiennius salei TaxID=6928 RepID=A0A061QLG7_CUPSA